MEPIIPIIIFFAVILIGAAYQLLKDREQRFHTVTWLILIALWIPFIVVRVLAVSMLLRLELDGIASDEIREAAKEAVGFSVIPEFLALAIVRFLKLDIAPSLSDHHAEVRRRNELYNQFYFTRRAARRSDICRMAFLLGVSALLGTIVIGLYLARADLLTMRGTIRMDELKAAGFRGMLVSAAVFTLYALYYAVHGYKKPLPADPFTNTLPRKHPPLRTTRLRGRGLSTSEEAGRDWMDSR